MNVEIKEQEWTLLQIACLPKDQALPLWHYYRQEQSHASTHYRYLPAIYIRFDAWDALTPDDDLLRNAYLKMWSRNQTILNRALKLTALLNEHGIPIMFIKSTALMLGYQIPTGYRYITDVDFVIPYETVNTMVPILLEDSWQLVHGSLQPYKLPLTHSYDCISPEGIRSDVHWRVHHHASSMMTKASWSSAQPIDLPDHSACSVPAINDLFHLICYHGGRALIRNPYWAIDACLMLNRYGDVIDWDKQYWYLKQEILPASSARALLFLHDKLAADIPERSIRDIRDYVPDLKRRLLHSIGDNPQFKPKLIRTNLYHYIRSDYIHNRGIYTHIRGMILMLLSQRDIRSLPQFLRYCWKKLKRLCASPKS